MRLSFFLSSLLRYFGTELVAYRVVRVFAAFGCLPLCCTMSGVQPVFLKNRDIPISNASRPATVLELCVAAERTTGQGGVVGSQVIGGLWRLYPANAEARSNLLVRGLRIRGVSLQVSGVNPFILRGDSGEEKPSTKVWVDGVPISVANSEIEHSLVQAGCELRSSVKMDRARDVDNKLTRFLTGRRFVFITVPKAPLDRMLQVSVFRASIFHKEQKFIHKQVTCSNCLEKGHHVSSCTKDTVCMACRQTGHKRGSPNCQIFFSDPLGKEGETGDNRPESGSGESGEKESEGSVFDADADSDSGRRGSCEKGESEKGESMEENDESPRQKADKEQEERSKKSESVKESVRSQREKTDDKKQKERSKKGEGVKDDDRSPRGKAESESGKNGSSKKSKSVKEGDMPSNEKRNSQNVNKDVDRKQNNGEVRGRATYKQTDLRSSLQVNSSSRSRSETPKRPIPGDFSSPESTVKKRATGRDRQVSNSGNGD